MKTTTLSKAKFEEDYGYLFPTSINITANEVTLCETVNDTVVLEKHRDEVVIIGYIIGYDFTNTLIKLAQNLDECESLFIRPTEFNQKQLSEYGFIHIPNRYILKYEPKLTIIDNVKNTIKNIIK